ncbi:hypothetical protein SDC9_119693 [bioreactor metagenome]|uniref:Uncharacterized protein n=1 Tax=bioreactor metagenome TaxID=1076179 RepID=A0A645C6D2_9ZZZZ|nr:hypothetical protein [Bacilli bacterium]
MKRLFIVALVLLVSLSPMFAQGGAETGKKQQTLTVYCGQLEEHAAAVCQAFEKATGIKTSSS